MKTLTQVVLPIAALVGIVFGVTWMNTHMSKDSSKTGEKPKVGGQAESLKFPLLIARKDPSDWRLRYWNSEFEPTTKGHFDFWFRNVNDQPVRFAAMGVSCQCAGALVGVIPPEAMSSYLTQRAIAQFPGLPGSPILDIANLIELNNQISWKSVVTGPDRGETSIPGAGVSSDEQMRAAHLNPGNPQFAIVRLTWEAKQQADNTDRDAHTSISGHFVSQLPNSNAAAMDLQVGFTVAQPLHVFVPGDKSGEIRLNELLTGSIVTRELVIWSSTRSELPIAIDPITPGNYKDCVTWTPPTRLTENEVLDLEQKLMSPDQPPIKIRSAYRVFLTVSEQRQIERDGKMITRQLDLGPFYFQLQVGAGTKPVTLIVHGVVRGDVRLINGSISSDAVDFGRSFSSSTSKTIKVSVLSERVGMDLEEIKAERSPDYLIVDLLPDGEKEGKKQWILTVTIPESKLFGDLPLGSQVVLQTKDKTPRRVRIPVKARTLD